MECGNSAFPQLPSGCGITILSSNGRLILLDTDHNTIKRRDHDMTMFEAFAFPHFWGVAAVVHIRSPLCSVLCWLKIAMER